MSTPIDDFGTLPMSAQSAVPPPPPSNSARSQNNDEDDKTLRLTQWVQVDVGTYKTCPPTRPILPPGMYVATQIRNGETGIETIPINVDELLEFPDTDCDKILNEIEGFWNTHDKFKMRGFLHRRGYMFYGPHGSGKTCLVQQIVKRIITRNGLVMVCNDHPRLFSSGLSQIRMIEPTRPIVCVYEDIDAIIKKHGDSDILGILDGENQIDIVLNIATTNYPELLDKRLIARPRRFDMLIKIGWPSAEVRKLYFQKKLKIDDKAIDKWVAATEDFSFAACAELVISVECLGKDFDKSVKLLKDLQTQKVSSSQYEGNDKFGFGK